MQESETVILSYWLQIREFVEHDEGDGLLGYVVLTFLLAVVVALGSNAFGVDPVTAFGGLSGLAGSILSAWL